MSDLKIKVVATATADKKTKTGKDYIELEVTYKNLTFQEKVESKKLNPFGNKQVYDTLKNSSAGDVFTIQRVKEGEYWQWVGISEGGSAVPSTSAAKPSGATATPKSTYETPEERAKKQVYIVRQSSIGAAIETLSVGAKAPPKKEDVVELAKYYEGYVFGKEEAPKLAELPPNDDLEDDIPY